MTDPKQIEHDGNEKPAEPTYGWTYLFGLIVMAFGMAYARDPAATTAGLASWKAGIASWFGY